MGRKSVYGTTEKAGSAAISGSKSGVRHGPNSKNVHSSRRNKSSNAGTMTGPIKGRDRGTG